jgi:glycosyltransferase involved in cell wall biosynthesis
VALLGELPRERALAVVAACDVFVRPTLVDGDAVSVREALALGRPVAASAVGARPPQAQLFPAGDAAALTELLFRVSGTGGTAEYHAPVDCLVELVAIYRELGAAATLGTPLAI